MPPDDTTTPPDATADPVTPPAPEPETPVSGDPVDSSSTTDSQGGDSPVEAPEAPGSEATPPVVKDENPTPETPTSQPENEPNSPQTPVASATVPEPNFLQELLQKANAALRSRKRAKLERIMTLFAKRTKITNDEVEKLLHVSDATATRYLSTLEREGKITQSGKTGHSVFYTKI
ncbi:MAG: hypothetical protein PHV42_02930 [Candidatus Pacebacteria bacterium]|nr:hypothetical protein [Candidatus Paceibacterota bacterium]